MKSQLLHLGIYLLILGGGFCLVFLSRKGGGGVCVEWNCGGVSLEQGYACLLFSVLLVCENSV